MEISMETAFELILVALLTFAIELPIVILGMIGTIKRIGFGKLVLNIFLVNLITNLCLNVLLLINSFYGYPFGRIVSMAILEVFVFAAECVMYAFCFKDKVSKLRICIVTLVANLVSFLLGLLMF